jgi:hypothetical protein
MGRFGSGSRRPSGGKGGFEDIWSVDIKIAIDCFTGLVDTINNGGYFSGYFFFWSTLEGHNGIF